MTAVMNGDIITINSQIQNAKIYGESSFVTQTTTDISSTYWSQFRIWLLNWGGTGNSNSYTTNSDTSLNITTGKYIGLELVPPNATSGDTLQTGPESGSDTNTIQNQTSSWSDNSGSSEFRVWMLVSTDGQGFLQEEGSNSDPRTIIGNITNVIYGDNYVIQSVGKAIGKNDYLWWFNNNSTRITVNQQNFPWTLSPVSDPSTYTGSGKFSNSFNFQLLNSNREVPTMSCSTTSDCTSGLVCKSGMCVGCTSNTDCSGAGFCQNGICITCSSNSDCPTGKICQNGQCFSCTSNSDCPSGETCSNNTCVKDTSNNDWIWIIIIGAVFLIILGVLGFILYEHEEGG